MTPDGGERRRRMWRWALVVWAVTVAVGGGLTLWLQDSTEPPPATGRHGRQETADPAAPLLRLDVDDSECPGPGVSPEPREEPNAVLCAYATLR
ncbi:hypothetical protein OG985_16865 [Streptomyces sp. NBC_00289]|uniref:hypothetical protein n=1 Tax=Streptomyces sp. NBC_00289 TaxID=2975703 RepID=UPI003244F763